MKIVAQDLQYKNNRGFYLLDKITYHNYRKEIENISSDTIVLKKRWLQMALIINETLEKVDIDYLIRIHIDNYIKRKCQEFNGGANMELFLRVFKGLYEGTVQYILKYIDMFADKTQNDRESTYNTRDFNGLEDIYLSYLANQTNRTFWFNPLHHSFSAEFYEVLYRIAPRSENLITGEDCQDYLTPIFIGDQGQHNKTIFEPYSDEDGYIISKFYLSEKMLNYLHRKLSNHKEAFAGAIQEDYQLFLTMVERAIQEDLYLVINFIG